MKRDFGRSDRRALRELASSAWERELGAELTILASSFDEWKAGRLSPHELNARIHEFHQGASRDLYALYTRVHPSQLVARAVGHGVLADTEVPGALLAELAGAVEYYRNEPAALAEDREGKSQE